jgi:hypothetical protein
MMGRYNHATYSDEQHRVLKRWAKIVTDAARGIYPQNADEGDVVWGTQFGNKSA